MKKKPVKVSTQDKVDFDKQKIVLQQQKKESEKKYKLLIGENANLQRMLDASLELKRSIKTNKYIYTIPNKIKSEAVAFAIASDWHYEENIDKNTVDGYNEYNVTIANERASQFFKTVVRLCEVEGTFSKIDTLVLALLGDFISGNIHEALLEICELKPMPAIIAVQNILVSGIQFILDNTKLNLIIPCHVGNHTRITEKVHIATEAGNSLETLMYHHIANHFRDNKRVTFKIATGYLSYLQVWDYTVCFQHGHAVKFGGGVGGITIPLRKAIAQWQKKRHADLYILGHWHQFLDVGDAIVNGSMIGYSSYVQFIKADPERPKQAFFVLSKKFNEKISVRPILFSV